MSFIKAAAKCCETVFIFLVVLISLNALCEAREEVIYAFAGQPDCGNLPTAPMIADREGNLFGTTLDGGAYGAGCVFELSQGADGSWTETVLHSFAGADGSRPAAGLVFDNLGNLFGTTEDGGTYGGGTVFELSPSGGGDWNQAVLYSFGGTDDGFTPQCQLVFDGVGNLYGTTSSGGNRKSQFRGGTVFKLSPSSNGWTETILYSFPGLIAGPNGADPAGGVVMDAEGNLFGVVGFGGANGAGAVYELKLKAGTYRERLIHSFDQLDGAEPNSLTFGPDGNLYGTASFGGVPSLNCPDCGVVFQLIEAASGTWVEKTLLSLHGGDGFSAVGPPVFDSEGNLYAAAQFGAQVGHLTLGRGSVFKLTPRPNGIWKETVLHRFEFSLTSSSNADGLSPYAGVIVNQRQLFGTTSSGGIYDNGTVFTIKLHESGD